MGIQNNGRVLFDINGRPIDVFSGALSTTSTFSTDSNAGDAFGRLRVSNPDLVYAQKFLYNKADGTFFDEVVNGTATSTHDASNACVNMAVSSDGDYVIRQSKQRHNYQAGKGQLIYMTGIITPTNDTVQRIGYFQGGTSAPYDVIDGLCFEADEQVFSVNIYKGGSKEQTATRNNWNIDKLDGTGPSGKTINFGRCQIYVIDFQYLGVGRVRFGFDIDGVVYYVHQFLNANSVTNVYMRSPNQPIRYEVRSTGGEATMKQICCSVQSEGGKDPAGLVAAVYRDANLSISTNWLMLKAIRLKSAQLDATVSVLSKSTIAVSSGDYQWALFWNPTIAGTYVWSDVSGSSIQEADGDGTNTVTPSLPIDTGYNSSDTDAVTQSVNSTLRLGSNIDGTQDVIALCIRTISGSDNFQGSMTLRELI